MKPFAIIKKIKQRLKMLNDEEIEGILDINIDDENNIICFICSYTLQKQKMKKTLTDVEIRKVLILISIFEKHINEIKNENDKQKLKKFFNDELNIKGLKEYKNNNKIKSSKEEIETYLKDIKEDIKKIRELKELKIQEQKDKIQKQKDLENQIQIQIQNQKQKEKNMNEGVNKLLGNDKLSF